MRTNRGARVADLDRSGMRAAYEARLVIEPGAARLAARAPPARAAARMREALARQRRAAGGVHARFAANRDFHLALVAASGNPFLEQLAGVLWVARIGEAIYEAQARDAGAHAARRRRARGDPRRRRARPRPRRRRRSTRRHIAAAIERSAL